jgi:hypothetical protein
VLALAASACGGGGGGNVTPPGGGGGGGGTPTPSPTNSASSTPSPGQSPTSTPGHTPTPTPTHTPTPQPTPTPTPGHTPTPTPTATPTPPPRGSTFLPDTTGRFGLIQVLDQYGRGGLMLTTSQIQIEAPHYDSVWGAFQPDTWRTYNPNIFLTRYYMPWEDNNLVSGNTLSYFQQNHPDWILYGCDQNGNPTQHYAYTGTGFNDTPLDIHNPAVVSYQLQTIVNFLRANHYNAIAIDNITFSNYLVSPNTTLEHIHSNAGWYGCGIWDANFTHFTYRYGGPGVADLNQPDPNFIADLNNWVAQAKRVLGQNGMKVVVNHFPTSYPPSGPEQTLLGNIDGMLDEGGYVHYGTDLTGGAFARTFNWVQLLQSRGIAALVTDYYCLGAAPPCSNDPGTLTPAEVDWSLASYAIGNNGGEDVFISPHSGAVFSFRNEYLNHYGTPCPGGLTVNGSLYTRQFSGGFAVVNAGGGSAMVQLPNHAYSDVEGRAISNPLTVNAEDGFMLLTNGNGCS